MLLKYLQNRKLKKAKDYLAKSKQFLKDEIDDALKNAERDISSFRDLLEQSKNHGVQKHINFFNLNIHTSFAYADLVVLIERIRLTDRRLEKLMYSRFLVMVLYEFLSEINSLIGKDFVRELQRNNFHDLIPEFKDIGKKFSKLNSDNEKEFKHLRDKTAAHKNYDALVLTNSVYNLDSEKIVLVAIDTISVISELVKKTTMVIEKILEDINNLPK